MSLQWKPMHLHFSNSIWASLRCITMLGSNQAFLELLQGQHEAMGTLLHEVPPLLFNCAHPLSAKFKVICIQCNGPVNRKYNVVWPPVEGERNAWPTIPLGSFPPPLTGWIYLCQDPVLTRIPPLTTSSHEHFRVSAAFFFSRPHLSG